MKKITSIKTRITIWYTALLAVLISVVLLLVGSLSFKLSMNNLENDLKLQVTKASFAGMGPKPSKESFFPEDRKKEFKNVSIYLENGEHIGGKYNYDLSGIEFKDRMLRRETVDDIEYLIYDVYKPGRPDEEGGGIWVRGAESITYSNMLGKSVFSILYIIIPIILLLTALGGYLITKKAFSPINNIIKTANEISKLNDIEKRIAIENSKHDELYELSVTLNNMLDKIELLIKKEKQFTSDASHELRTPISVILAQGEYLLDIAETEKEKELAETIVAKANQISKLVSCLLLLARIDSEKQKLNIEKIDFSVLVDIIAEEQSAFAESKNIKIKTNVPLDIIISADEALLMSAVSNLINNAIKYGRDGGEVSISAKKMDEKTEIIVSDNGIGIAEENLNKIWGRFFRVDDIRNDEFGSSGLGLAMVKSIVSLHGGEIAVTSEEGKGTEFRIVL